MSSQTKQLKLVFLNKSEAQTTFGEDKISWNVFPYFKGNSSIEYDVFKEVNDYIETLPLKRQEALFTFYREIYELIEYPKITFDYDLRIKVAQFLSLIDLNDIKNWIDLKAHIIIPSVLEEFYVESDENSGNRNRTYIREDYKWLIAMAIYLRFMTPIWGEYIARTAKEKGNNFKEFYAAELIEDSAIQDSIPMQKLKLFVLENIPVEKPLLSSTLAAFSEEDFPSWVLRLVLVKKLAVEDIRGLNNDSHLIKVIFQFIRQRLRNVDNSFYGEIKGKFQEEGATTGDDTNNLSKIEGYKIRQELSSGDVAFIRYSLKDPMVVARKLNPNISEDLVFQAIESTKALEQVVIDRAQRAFLQYVFRPIVSPSGMMLLNKIDLIRNLGVAQAVLWQAGWFDIAALMTGIRIDTDDYMNIAYSGVRSRITKAQTDKLDYLYPYTKRLQGKQKIAKNQNVAMIEIERLNDDFIGFDWKLCIPQVWIEKANLPIKSTRYSVPLDIRVKIADFVISIAENKYPFKTEGHFITNTKPVQLTI